MVNRNRGSGTRVLIEEILQHADEHPPGYHFEARSHNAVAVAVSQGRADWGIAIGAITDLYDLEFRPIREERYDFVIPESRKNRNAVAAFCDLLASPEVRAELAALGFGL